MTACSGGSTSSIPSGSNTGGTTGTVNTASQASNPNPNSTGTTYTLAQTVSIPNASSTWSFDISYVSSIGATGGPVAANGNPHRYFLSDRNNSGIDVVDTQTLQLIRTAGQGSFVGNTGNSDTSGPNGVVAINNDTVFAGDGNSTLKVLNTDSGSLLATIGPLTDPAQPPGTSVCTPPSGPTRTDEGNFDPTDNVALFINDAACPPFGTFVSTNPPYNIVGQVAFPTATGGAEQPVWDPTQNKWLESLPSTTANPGGEIDVIDPHTFKVTNTFSETGCNGAGAALGQNEKLFIGCGATTGTEHLLIMNAANGTIIATINNVGGCDEVWYNPGDNRFYGACSSNVPGPVLAVVDGSSNKLLTTVTTSAGAHSVAADSVNNRVFVPQRGQGVTVYTH